MPSVISGHMLKAARLSESRSSLSLMCPHFLSLSCRAPILATCGGHRAGQGPGEACQPGRICTASGRFPGHPFCQAPPGSLRFAPPQPADPWPFVKNATSYPPMCSQDTVAGQMLSDLFTNRKENTSVQISEDCLYLNIYTPADLTKESRLPVMVWIHGGGLVLGGASTYDGLVLSAHKNMVVVIIQYRLGIWGFLSTGDEHCRGNWGHLDQLAALRWVQENIANFGGDPGSVTIFGQSAGGASVSVLVLSPLAKDLFHRAISESGVALTAVVSDDYTRAQFANFSGCNTTTSAVIVDCLRQKSEKEGEVGVSLRWGKHNTMLPLPQSYPFLTTVVDGVLLPKMPEEILAEKKFNTVPYIVGINKHEFGWIIPTVRMCWCLRLTSSILHITSPVSVAIEKYLGGTDDPVKKKDLFLDLMGDLMFGVPIITLARLHRDAGASTYVYEFQYRPSFSSVMRPKTVMWDHGDELFSLFGAPFLKGGASEEEIKLSKMVMKFWANFARTGDPGAEELPHWPAYDQNEGYLKIGVPIEADQKLKDKEVAFWTELLAQKAVEEPPQTEH
uniref:Carboxylic ester hydrolase n=1 Tax=Equus asinus asinus TaxID=83772 RepID=A0A8C4MMA8_EQUAS